jgi:predicted nucleic acid-binding Zn ribbon protein
MRKQEAQSLGDILKEALRSLNIDGKLYETRLLEAWPEIVGPILAEHTTHTRICNGILHVQLDTPILRSELQLMRSSLIQRLNGAVGVEVIHDIRFR